MNEIRDLTAFAINQLGWEKLKDLQLKVITALVAGQIFCVFPTSY